MTDTTQHDEELAQLKAQVVAQQARIAQMRDALQECVNVVSSFNNPKTWSVQAVDAGIPARKALATTDDLSALKQHDDELWNEALTRGVEWQATRGHTLDADDYGNELRSLKR